LYLHPFHNSRITQIDNWYLFYIHNSLYAWY